MKNTRWIMLAIVVLAVGGVLALKVLNSRQSVAPLPTAVTPATPVDQIVLGTLTDLTPGRPSLIEYGGEWCKPCQAMQPILKQLKKDRGDKLNVLFCDVKKFPGPANEAKIELIPTQVFKDAQGVEIARHEGFYAREEIDTVLAKLGIR